MTNVFYNYLPPFSMAANSFHFCSRMCLYYLKLILELYICLLYGLLVKVRLHLYIVLFHGKFARLTSRDTAVRKTPN